MSPDWLSLHDTAKAFPDDRCDKNFSGWVERPKPWILRLLGL
jgi:hypothetical protein